jgi:hypothetical protein
VIDNFGARNGFWVSVAAGTIALATVLLGQKSLAGRRNEAPQGALPQPAE